jgi:4a-hydroxytetrahydrobiopterin dehydratase
MRTAAELAAAHCRPLQGEAAMSGAEITTQLQVLPEWRLSDGALSRTCRFADYYETLAFVNALAFMVHREDHHPDLVVGYNRCEIRFSTHSAAGVTENDFICAAKADAIFDHCYGAVGA